MHPVRVIETSFQDGVDGYAGTRDADIRGSGVNPLEARRVWNQGAQDVLRTGHRPPLQSTNEIYRSMLRWSYWVAQC